MTWDTFSYLIQKLEFLISGVNGEIAYLTAFHEQEQCIKTEFIYPVTSSVVIEILRYHTLLASFCKHESR